MTLRELVLKAYPDLAWQALPELAISGVECDSRQVGKNYLFIAIRGLRTDGNGYIAEAISRGAVAVVSDVAPPRGTAEPVFFLSLPEPRLAAARLAAAYYGHPAQSLKVIGITGTNGKTTVSYLLEHLLSRARLRTGVIGTVSYRYPGKEIPAIETTPGPLKAQAILSEMVQAGCEAAVMEVSSHALDQNRVAGIDFEAALFTNLTQDHLDYHGNMENYFACKGRLFSGLSDRSGAVINADDAWAVRLAGLTKAQVITYAIDSAADFRAVGLESDGHSTTFELRAGGCSPRVRLPLIGRHNVYNALGALAMSRRLGLDLEKAAADLSDFPGVPGRLERVEAGQDFSVFIDFAHTPDGLQNVLQSLLPYRTARLIAVFGCGGDRDRGKRPKMAAAAAAFCDSVVLTSDNPRDEDPRRILDEIRAGFPDGFTNFSVVLDRRKAIRQALLAARTGDIVLLAGKGHERTQIIGARAEVFSDKQEALRVLHGH